MRTIDRLLGKKPTEDRSMSLDQWVEAFTYGSHQYPLGLQTKSLRTGRVDIDNNFVGYVHAIHKQSGVVAAAVTARALLLSQLRFKWRSQVEADNGKLFGTQALTLLERPAYDVTRPDLLMVAEQHASYAGNAYLWNSPVGLRTLRPDWVSIILGSDLDSTDPALQADAHAVAYVYTPGGATSNNASVQIPPMDVAHWKPEPDPELPWRGLSWVQSVLTQIGTDRQASEFKGNFFENGATPQVIVSLDPAVTQDQASKWAEMFAASHEGAENAFKTLVIGGGADAKVVGSNLSELSLRDTQGSDETRIASRSRVPAVVLGISEGMQGSSLNSGNYSQTRRLWADGWFTPTADNLCASLERILPPPANSELSYDPSRIMFLQEDRKDEAEIMSANASALRQLVDGGFDPDSAVEAVTTNDAAKLVHSGKLSVQLQPPGETLDPSPPGGNDAV